MATRPSNGTASKVRRMASTAASSAAFLSPLPRHAELAIAAWSTASRKCFARSAVLLMFDSNPRLNICLFACFDAQRRRFERPERPFPRALCRPPGPFRPPP